MGTFITAWEPQIRCKLNLFPGTGKVLSILRERTIAMSKLARGSRARSYISTDFVCPEVENTAWLGSALLAANAIYK